MFYRMSRRICLLRWMINQFVSLWIKVMILQIHNGFIKISTHDWYLLRWLSIEHHFRVCLQQNRIKILDLDHLHFTIFIFHEQILQTKWFLYINTYFVCIKIGRSMKYCALHNKKLHFQKLLIWLRFRITMRHLRLHLLLLGKL